MIIEILTIRESTVGWKDIEGDLYVYPRCMFPAELRVNTKFDYSAGEFHEILPK